MGALESAMSAKVQNFDKRLTRIVRKHRSMSNGYGFRVDKSGLITIKPKRAKGTSPIFILFMVLCVGVLFKAVALANLGLRNMLTGSLRFTRALLWNKPAHG